MIYLELTDTFGGELNYSHVTRFKVKAKTLQGAVRKVSMETGLRFNYNGVYYKAKRACIGLIDMGWDVDESNYSRWVEL